MIKVSLFDKIDDIMFINTLKQLFEGGDIEIFRLLKHTLTDVTPLPMTK